jgi:hypothetical protein
MGVGGEDARDGSDMGELGGRSMATSSSGWCVAAGRHERICLVLCTCSQRHHLIGILIRGAAAAFFNNTKRIFDLTNVYVLD